MTAPTRAAAEVLSMYPWLSRTDSPLERALHHAENAANSLRAACDHVDRLRCAAAGGDEAKEFEAFESCAWNLESAEWHLSQIPAAYRG